MKTINDILFICQARLESQRVPNKMLRQFCDSTLVDILIDKIKKSSIIPMSNFYLSIYDKKLIDLSKKHQINYFKRSHESVLVENNIPLMFEWSEKLKYKYVILISACNPLLKIETIDSFTKDFINSNKEGAFAVFEKKTYYWDKNGNSLTDYKGSTNMNTKYVDPIYEAAHCLYASRMDIIKDGFWLDTKSPPNPHLFIMNELEAFDIDYEWQFTVAEELYKNKEKIIK